MSASLNANNRSRKRPINSYVIVNLTSSGARARGAAVESFVFVEAIERPEEGLALSTDEDVVISRTPTPRLRRRGRSHRACATMIDMTVLHT